mmetsp:Transcript_103036/g.332417  ORF Transcript_103036/g.332417 Transcript_103036/m.332417 type:complete len:236 (-) Transcript_103036:8-715(-)
MGVALHVRQLRGLKGQRCKDTGQGLHRPHHQAVVSLRATRVLRLLEHRMERPVITRRQKLGEQRGDASPHLEGCGLVIVCGRTRELGDSPVSCPCQHLLRCLPAQPAVQALVFHCGSRRRAQHIIQGQGQQLAIRVKGDRVVAPAAVGRPPRWRCGLRHPHQRDLRPVVDHERQLRVGTCGLKVPTRGGLPRRGGLRGPHGAEGGHQERPHGASDGRGVCRQAGGPGPAAHGHRT